MEKKLGLVVPGTPGAPCCPGVPFPPCDPGVPVNPSVPGHTDFAASIPFLVAVFFFGWLFFIFGSPKKKIQKRNLFFGSFPKQNNE